MKFIFLFIIQLFTTATLFAQSSEELTEKAYQETLKENYQAAYTLYNKAIIQDSLNAELYTLRASFLEEVGESRKAMADYSMAIELDSTHVMALHRRAILYYSFNYPDDAINDANKALKYLDEKDSLRYVIINNRGNAHLIKRDFSSAYQDYLITLSFDSTDKATLTNLSAALSGLERNEEAIYYAKKVIQLHPDFIGGYHNLAFKYSERGDYLQALELNNKVIELDSTQALAYNNRGYVKYKLGKLDDALEDINRSIKMYPENSYAYKNRALVHIEYNQIELACKDISISLELGFTKQYGGEVEELKRSFCENK